MNNYPNQKPALTIMDLLANCSVPTSELQPQGMKTQCHHRIVIRNNSMLPNNIAMGSGFTSLSAHNFKILPQQLDQSASESEDNNISLFSVECTQPMGRSLPTFSLHHPIQQMSFEEVCSDTTISLNPKRLNFIPASSWTNIWNVGCYIF